MATIIYIQFIARIFWLLNTIICMQIFVEKGIYVSSKCIETCHSKFACIVAVYLVKKRQAIVYKLLHATNVSVYFGHYNIHERIV